MYILIIALTRDSHLLTLPRWSETQANFKDSFISTISRSNAPPNLLRAFAMRPISPNSPSVFFSRWWVLQRLSSLPKPPESCDNLDDRFSYTSVAPPIEEGTCIFVERVSIDIRPRGSLWDLALTDRLRRICYNDCAGRAPVALLSPSDDCCSIRNTCENPLSKRIITTH